MRRGVLVRRGVKADLLNILLVKWKIKWYLFQNCSRVREPHPRFMRPPAHGRAERTFSVKKQKGSVRQPDPRGIIAISNGSGALNLYASGVLQTDPATAEPVSRLDSSSASSFQAGLESFRCPIKQFAFQPLQLNLCLARPLRYINSLYWRARWKINWSFSISWD